MSDDIEYKNVLCISLVSNISDFAMGFSMVVSPDRPWILDRSIKGDTRTTYVTLAHYGVTGLFGPSN